MGARAIQHYATTTLAIPTRDTRRPDGQFAFPASRHLPPTPTPTTHFRPGQRYKGRHSLARRSSPYGGQQPLAFTPEAQRLAAISRAERALAPR